MPFDFLLHALARDYGARCACVILSGSGTDGSLGLMSVKESAGIVIVQRPEEAGYDGMPRSAVATGLVDFELPPAEMPTQLLAYIAHAHAHGGKSALAATPGVYLIPVGADAMRSPPLGDVSTIRSWTVNDITIPLPFNIGGSEFSTKPLYTSADSLTEPLFGLRKHAAFRPVSKTSVFTGTLSPSQFTNTRLIGRSVWNTRWKLVIPGYKLLHDPNEGLDRFVNTVKDIKLHYVTYSYSGN